MKALLDEHLSPQIAALLREAGYDVVAVAERDDLLACSDRMLFETATAEGHAVMTNSIKDFRRLAAECRHPGLIRLPANRARTRAAVPAAVRAILGAQPEGIAGSER